jgi:antitoxin (DNA-binding transcriptional repressor) of toxin-antitoxin stability system
MEDPMKKLLAEALRQQERAERAEYLAAQVPQLRTRIAQLMADVEAAEAALAATRVELQRERDKPKSGCDGCARLAAAREERERRWAVAEALGLATRSYDEDGQTDAERQNVEADGKGGGR